MKIKKSTLAKQPGYPSRRQFLAKGLLAGAAAIGTASVSTGCRTPGKVRDGIIEPEPALGGIPPHEPVNTNSTTSDSGSTNVAQSKDIQQAPGTIKPEPTQTLTGESTSYKIRKGDTLSSISKDCLGSENRWQEIAELNPGINPKKLKIGTELKIPAKAKRNAIKEDGPIRTKGKMPAEPQSATNGTLYDTKSVTTNKVDIAPDRTVGVPMRRD